MLIQLHLLQNYSPANLNRDDTGAPKDALFGGVRRGRVSSQCLKRSIRKSTTFEDAFRAEGRLAARTKGLPALVQIELAKLGTEPKVVQAIVARVAEIGRESSKKAADEGDADSDAPEIADAESAAEAETKQLIFLGHDELSMLSQKLLVLYRQYGDEKKWAKAKISDITKSLGSSVPRSVDVAMFGRMTTSEAFGDVQAAVQVAHALSVNALAEEFDYYTAVDDLSGESGAGMIGDIEFNCSTYYKYYNVHWEQLVENLGGDAAVARRAVLALVEAAATAQPTGKQNTFAAHCLPDLVLVEVRERNLPVNYANAFLKPARASGSRTVIDDAISKLTDYMARVGLAYGLTTDRRAFLALQEASVPDAESARSLADLQTWLKKQLPEQ